MDITSLLNAKTPEPEELAGSGAAAVALLHADNRRTISHTSARHNLPPLTTDNARPAQNFPPYSTKHPTELLESNRNRSNSTRLPLPIMQVSRQPYAQPMQYPEPPMVQPSQTVTERPAQISQGSPEDVGNESTLNKTFVCSSCEKSFARRSDLVRHERIHSGVRPHHCDYPGCDKEFIQRSALTVHKRVHTGEKPHKCTSCDKTFSDSSSLARHRRIHTGRRPYKCEVTACGKTFTRKTTLKRHEQQHEAKRARGEVSPTAPQLSDSHSSPTIMPSKVESEANTTTARPSGSESSVQSNTPPASAIVEHYQQAPPTYNEMSSYPEAIYATKALDYPPQNVIPESCYKPNPAHLYPSPTESLRHPTSSMLGYSNSGLSIGSQPVVPQPMGPQSSYHTVSAPATVYGISRSASIQQSPTLYHSQDHATQLAPFQHPHQQQQHQLQYPGHQPEMMNHYPPLQRLNNIPHDQKYWPREGI